LLGREAQSHFARGESVEAIRNAAEKAAVLVQQLMAFGRMQFMKSQMVDIDTLLLGLNGELRKTVGSSVMVSIQLNGGIPRIKVDQSQMAKVLMVLAANARDAMPNGGQFTLSTKLVAFESGNASLPSDAAPGQYACLVVTDTGCGMDEVAMSRLFEPFFTTKDVGAGVGLSLSSAYGIVKQHGGWILVESSPGCGATFKLLFPIPSPRSN
jgi:signal transduction histidine kinase